MPNAASLKKQIEAKLAHKIPAALSPVVRTEAVKQSLADPSLNQLLAGGIPTGAISEIYGSACSGRTSLVLSLAAAVTASEKFVAWVDVTDTLDPETAALGGVDLQRLLWVRCSDPSVKANQLELDRSHALQGTVINTAGALAPNLVSANHVPKPVGNGGCGSPHPRGEDKGMAAAIDSLLQTQPRSAVPKQGRAAKSIGTPGAPNRDLGSLVQAMRKDASGNLVLPDAIVPTCGNLFGRQVERKVSCGSNRLPAVSPQRPPMPFPKASPYREEQIPTDRQPSRRFNPAAEISDAKAKPRVALCGSNSPHKASRGKKEQNLWPMVDQALRTVDLLLQAGGFSLLVLDLGDLPAHVAWRIPLATWFRFRSGCERSRSSLFIISQHPCARAIADLTLAAQSSGMQSVGGKVAVGSRMRLQVEQQRRTSVPDNKIVSIRKHVCANDGSNRSNTWMAGAHWGIRA